MFMVLNQELKVKKMPSVNTQTDDEAPSGNF